MCQLGTQFLEFLRLRVYSIVSLRRSCERSWLKVRSPDKEECVEGGLGRATYSSRNSVSRPYSEPCLRPSTPAQQDSCLCALNHRGCFTFIFGWGYGFQDDLQHIRRDIRDHAFLINNVFQINNLDVASFDRLDILIISCITSSFKTNTSALRIFCGRSIACVGTS